MTAEPKKPLWRRFEDASPEEREGMLAWREWVDVGNGHWVASDDLATPGLATALGIPFDVERSPADGESEKDVIHDERWIRMRASFYRSQEWKQFRLQWLQTHPACVRCGRTDGILQVHHAGHYTLDHTVMAEGFLEALKHPERFETTCWDCHQKVHADLIEAERGMMRRAKKRGARRSLRSSRPA